MGLAAAAMRLARKLVRAQLLAVRVRWNWLRWNLLALAALELAAQLAACSSSLRFNWRLSPSQLAAQLILTAARLI